MGKANRIPERLERGDSFFGLHFDFHAGPDCTEIGKNVTPRMVEKIIKAVGPDYIQCDCKGHRGIASYPTKLGNAAPGFVRDQLRIWRKATAKHGVALYMHYSGLVDREAVRRHPSWAIINEDGKRDEGNTSFFSPYLDKLLIPQFKELIDEYGIDGAWVDGEAWAVKPDYGAKSVEAFRKATGCKKIPTKPGDPHWHRWMAFHRELFRRHVAHYIDALHEHEPEFQITSNWLYSSYMPEPATIGADFISGDYSATDSLRTGRWQGRCMTRQGKPWDLMAWSFLAHREKKPCWTTKTIPQLQQEAAITISLGGGFQVYCGQRRDGSAPEWSTKLLAETAAFCRARQQFCHKAEAVPQVALLYAGEARYRGLATPFGHWSDPRPPIAGVLHNLLDSQYSVEVLCEHHLTGRMQEYPIIVVPEWNYLERPFKRELVEYVRAGGSLLLIGPESVGLFKKELGISLRGKAEKRKQWIEHDGWLGALDTESQFVTLKKGTKPFGRLYLKNDLASQWETAAGIRRLGRGRIAGVFVGLGERYLNARTAAARGFLDALVRQLFADPIVEVKGSHYVDVIVNRKGGKLCVNLINTSGPHSDPNVYTFDEIQPVGPLDITIRADARPKNVVVEPGHRRLRYRYEKGEITFRLPRVRIHDIVVVE